MGNVSPRSKSTRSKSLSALQKSQPVMTFHQVEYSKQEKKLMRLYLKDFIVDAPSTDVEVNIMLQHWEQLHLFHQHPSDGITRLVQLFDTFYEYLFQFAPEVRPIFRSSIQFKGRALMNIVGGIKGLLQSEEVIEKAARIAQRHVGYGVKCEYFNPLGLALVKTLESLAPTLWTSPVQNAWRVVFCHVSVLVLTQLDQELNHKIWKTITTMASPSKLKERRGSIANALYASVRGSEMFQRSRDSESEPRDPPNSRRSRTRSSSAVFEVRSRKSFGSINAPILIEVTKTHMKHSKSEPKLHQLNSTSKKYEVAADSPQATTASHPSQKSRNVAKLHDVCGAIFDNSSEGSNLQAQPIQCPHLDNLIEKHRVRRKSLRLVVPDSNVDAADVKPQCAWIE